MANFPLQWNRCCDVTVQRVHSMLVDVEIQHATHL